MKLPYFFEFCLAVLTIGAFLMVRDSSSILGEAIMLSTFLALNVWIDL